MEERSGEPTLADPVSQACTAAQFDEPDYARWCAAIREAPRRHRKQWEFCYILQVLESRGLLRPGVRALGFGVGRDPLAAVMADRGVEVTATDLDPVNAAARSWIATGQHAPQLQELNDRGICDPACFAALATYSHADMRDVGGRFSGYDFVWSACAFEHLGSLGAGSRFVTDALSALRTGGLAAHTTEYNIDDGWSTRRRGATVLYRRRDIRGIIAHAERRSFTSAVNWTEGAGSLDRYLDLPPYAQDDHVKLLFRGYRMTSFGLVLEARA